MVRPYHARVCSHGLHERSERRAAFLVILEHVVARARGRQQDRVARSRRPAGAEHHILEGRPTLERHLAPEIPLEELARLAVRDHQPALLPEHGCQPRVRLSFVPAAERSEEHTSELQSPCNLVCRLLLEKKKHTARPALLTAPRRTRPR